MIKHIALCGVAALGLAAVAAPAWSAAQPLPRPHAPGRQAEARRLGLSTPPEWTGASIRATISSISPTAPGRRPPRSPPTSRSGAASSSSPSSPPSAPERSSRTRPRPTAPAGSVQRKVGDFYASFMDEAAIEAKGAAPLKPMLDRVAAIRTPSDLARAFGELGQVGVARAVRRSRSIRTSRTIAATRPMSARAASAFPTAIIISTRPTRSSSRRRPSTRRTSPPCCASPGIADPDARAAAHLRSRDARSRSRTGPGSSSRQIEKLYNPMTMAELATKMPGFDWNAYLDAAGLGGSRPGHRRPAERAHRRRQAGRRPSRSRPGRTISPSAPSPPRRRLLPKAFVDENFAFNGKILSGTPQLQRALEARLRPGRQRHGRGGRPALRRPLLPAGSQGQGRRAGPQPHQGDGPPARRA